MVNVIDTEKIQRNAKKIHENSLDIKILQDELEDMLSDIDKNNIDYRKGKLSKEIFENDDKRFKAESVILIKKVNRLLDANLHCLKMMTGELFQQEMKKSSEEKINKNVRGKKRKKDKNVNKKIKRKRH